VALLSFHTITLPAQNALLKILEEPRGGVRFILITSNKETLLPTLLSRLQEQSLDKASLSEFSYVKQFLNANHSERMKLPCIVNLISAVDEENRKDREGVRMFILSLAAYLSSHNVASLHAKEVLEIASYAGDPSSSGKALLEYLSLLLPETKV
jgi:hypothetical protein